MTDLSKLSAKELEELAKEAQKLATQKKEDEKKALRTELVERIRSAGFTIEDIFPNAVAKPARGIPEIKFQDPSNPDNTWTGRGRKPRWLIDAEAAGREAEEFAV